MKSSDFFHKSVIAVYGRVMFILGLAAGASLTYAIMELLK